MPGWFTQAECEAAVERLVEIRIDREGGPGAYRDALNRIADGGAAAPATKAALDRARTGADRNVRDVLAALGAERGNSADPNIR